MTTPNYKDGLQHYLRTCRISPFFSEEDMQTFIARKFYPYLRMYNALEAYAEIVRNPNYQEIGKRVDDLNHVADKRAKIILEKHADDPALEAEARYLIKKINDFGQETSYLSKWPQVLPKIPKKSDEIKRKRISLGITDWEAAILVPWAKSCGMSRAEMMRHLGIGIVVEPHLLLRQRFREPLNKIKVVKEKVGLTPKPPNPEPKR